MTNPDDLFRRPDDQEVRRDQYDRPLILAPDGMSESPYTRASTLAKTLDDNTALGEWKARMTAKGVATNPDLIASYAALDVEFKAREIAEVQDMIEEAGDAAALRERLDELKLEAKAERKRARELQEMAMERAGSSRRRELGTALHRFTELHDKGTPAPYVPEDLRKTLDAYVRATSHIQWVAYEKFLVNDELKAAGTADRFGVASTGDGRARVYDVKTGRVDYGALSFAIQLAVYAGGVEYDPRTYQRTPLPFEVDMETGVIIHLDPIAQTCNLYEVDIKVGRRAAHAANFVREWRKVKMPADIISAILSARTREELNEIYAKNKRRWTERESRAATQRARELSHP